MHMRTTLNLDDDALARKRWKLTGLKEKTAVVHAGLAALIRRESARSADRARRDDPKAEAAPKAAAAAFSQFMILPTRRSGFDHFRRGNPSLAALLEKDRRLCHPFVVGELACGYLRSRESTIHLLRTLPEAPMMRHEEVLMLIERHRLMASGIGWIDAHCLGRRCWRARSCGRWMCRLRARRRNYPLLGSRESTAAKTSAAIRSFERSPSIRTQFGWCAWRR